MAAECLQFFCTALLIAPIKSFYTFYKKGTHTGTILSTINRMNGAAKPLIVQNMFTMMIISYLKLLKLFISHIPTLIFIFLINLVCISSTFIPHMSTPSVNLAKNV